MSCSPRSAAKAFISTAAATDAGAARLDQRYFDCELFAHTHAHRGLTSTRFRAL